MIKFAHIADCHINKNFINEGISSLTQIKEIIKKENCEFLLISGDFWDKLIYLTEDSPLNQAAEIIKDISLSIPIIMIYGNHDVKGSLEIFEKISNNITVISEPTILCRTNNKILPFNKEINNYDIVFLCIPYLRKEYIKKKIKEENIEEIIKNDIIIEPYIRHLKLEMLKNINNDVYKIAVAHGTMSDCKNSIGQELEYLTNDIHFIYDTFYDLDYAALGHIHLFQTLGHEFRACYPGSIYSVNFTEEDDKYCLIVTLENDKTLKIQPKKLNVKKVKTININISNIFTIQELNEKLKNINNEIIKDYLNTRFKINFFGLKENLEILDHLNFKFDTEDIIINKHVLENKKNNNEEEEEIEEKPETFKEKVINYIKNYKNLEWTQSLDEKLNKIIQDKLEYFNYEEND